MGIAVAGVPVGRAGVAVVATLPRVGEGVALPATEEPTAAVGCCATGRLVGPLPGEVEPVAGRAVGPESTVAAAVGVDTAGTLAGRPAPAEPALTAAGVGVGVPPLAFSRDASETTGQISIRITTKETSSTPSSAATPISRCLIPGDWTGPRLEKSPLGLTYQGQRRWESPRQ